jgi:hypothetical protein
MIFKILILEMNSYPVDSAGLLNNDSFHYYSLDNDPSHKLPNSFRVEANIFDTFLNVTLYAAEGLWANASLNSQVYSMGDNDSVVSLMDTEKLVKIL